MRPSLISWSGSRSFFLGLLLLFTLLGCSGGGQGGTLTAPGSTQSGSPTAIINAKITVQYFNATVDMSVKSVTMGFYPSNDKLLSDPKEEGKQFVRVELDFKNNGAEEFKMNYTKITLDTPTEKSVDITFLVNKGNVDDLLVSKDLAQGESISGALYFEVPDSLKMEDLAVSYKGYDTETREFKIPLNQ